MQQNARLFGAKRNAFCYKTKKIMHGKMPLFCCREGKNGAISLKLEMQNHSKLQKMGRKTD